MANNLDFTLQDNGLYVATKEVSGNFAIHLESDQEGTYTIGQKTDPDATRPASNHVYSRRTEIDEHLGGYVFPVELTITSTVPITYGSIIEA